MKRFTAGSHHAGSHRDLPDRSRAYHRDCVAQSTARRILAADFTAPFAQLLSLAGALQATSLEGLLNADATHRDYALLSDGAV